MKTRLMLLIMAALLLTAAAQCADDVELADIPNERLTQTVEQVNEYDQILKDAREQAGALNKEVMTETEYANAINEINAQSSQRIAEATGGDSGKAALFNYMASVQQLADNAANSNQPEMAGTVSGFRDNILATYAIMDEKLSNGEISQEQFDAALGKAVGAMSVQAKDPAEMLAMGNQVIGDLCKEFGITSDELASETESINEIEAELEAAGEDNEVSDSEDGETDEDSAPDEVGETDEVIETDESSIMDEGDSFDSSEQTSEGETYVGE